MTIAKKAITMFSVISLLILMISFTTMAAKIAATITGPSVLRAGDTFTVTVKADGDGLRAFLGEIRYNSANLVYKSNAIIPAGWKFDEFDAGTPGVITFLAIDDKMEAPLDGNVKVFSLTFQVKSTVAAGKAISITAADLQASDGTSDFSAPDFTFTVNLAAPLSSNNLLSSLKVANAEIAPAFNKNTTWYTASVPFSVTSLDISATAGNSKAKAAVAGNTLKPAGTTDVTVTVTAENGSKKTYTIRVTRAQDPDYKASGNADLKSMTPSAGILSPPFDAGVVQYYVYLPNEIVKFKAAGAAGDAKGSVEAGAEISLEVGENAYIVTGVAEDGTRKDYLITVLRMPLPGATVPAPTAVVEAESVVLSGILTGESGNPLKNTFIQIDSEQNGTRTNGSGFYQLSDVLFGEHTLYIKDSDDKVLGSMLILLVKGDGTRLVGDVITMTGDSVINLELKDGLRITGVESAAVNSSEDAQPAGRTVPLIGALLLAAITLLLGGVVSYFVLMARHAV